MCLHVVCASIKRSFGVLYITLLSALTLKLNTSYTGWPNWLDAWAPASPGTALMTLCMRTAKMPPDTPTCPVKGCTKWLWTEITWGGGRGGGGGEDEAGGGRAGLGLGGWMGAGQE